jgi:hypothetical protein
MSGLYSDYSYAFSVIGDHAASPIGKNRPGLLPVLLMKAKVYKRDLDHMARTGRTLLPATKTRILDILVLALS